MRTRVSLGCILAAYFFVTAQASAMVQVDHGIAGARLGASRTAVRAALGTPDKVFGGRNEFGAYTRYTYAGGLKVFFQGKTKVTSVFTTGLGDRTATGVGVGSTEADVVAGVKGAKCETIAGSRTCHTGKFLAGRRVTDFVISSGKVASVTVGFVLD
jgi:hypothetical protein